uniref:Uncharacterized protein n=1 Tax=Corethron hystrix TaxID=216773 RepID=A0A7S1BW72_9STRA
MLYHLRSVVFTDSIPPFLSSMRCVRGRRSALRLVYSRPFFVPGGRARGTVVRRSAFRVAAGYLRRTFHTPSTVHSVPLSRPRRSTAGLPSVDAPRVRATCFRSAPLGISRESSTSSWRRRVVPRIFRSSSYDNVWVFSVCSSHPR